MLEIVFNLMYHSSNAFVAGEALGFATESSDATFGILTGYFMDPEDEIDDLRHRLITLNGQLGRIDGRFDYSRIIAKFDDAPEDQVLLGKMRRQVDRMQRDLEQLQNPFGALHSPPTPYQHQLPSASSSSEIRPELGPGPATHVNSGDPAKIVQKSIVGNLADTPLILRGRPPLPTDIDQLPIDPSWGDCKRYDITMKRDKYDEVVSVARWIYDRMKAFPSSARK